MIKVGADMVKKSSCSTGRKFKVKKRYLLLIILLIVVVVAFRFCGNRGDSASGSSVLVEGIDFAADQSQISVNLLLTDDAVPEAQWRTISAGEDTYTPNGLAPDPLLGAYAVELVIDDTAFSEDLDVYKRQLSGMRCSGGSALILLVYRSVMI